jgi:beta-phosphoglucomutase-like phosphatase (HAD superfamily)
MFFKCNLYIAGAPPTHTHYQAARLGVAASDCAAVDTCEEGLAAAAAAGMRPVRVRDLDGCAVWSVFGHVMGDVQRGAAERPCL